MTFLIFPPLLIKSSRNYVDREHQLILLHLHNMQFLIGSVLTICVSYCSTPRSGRREITLALPLDVPQRHPNLCHSTSGLSLSLFISLSFCLFSSSIHPSPNQLAYSSRWFSIEGRGLPKHCLIFFSSQFPHGQIHSSQRKEQRDKEPSLLAKQCPTQQIISTVGLGSSWVEKGVRGCNRMLLLGLVECHWSKY